MASLAAAFTISSGVGGPIRLNVIPYKYNVKCYKLPFSLSCLIMVLSCSAGQVPMGTRLQVQQNRSHWLGPLTNGIIIQVHMGFTKAKFGTEV